MNRGGEGALPVSRKSTKGYEVRTRNRPENLRATFMSFVVKISWVTSRFGAFGLLSAAVVFLVVDLVRHAILLSVDLGTLLRRQLSAVGRPIIADLAINARFFPL